jgi:hypothetical protein
MLSSNPKVWEVASAADGVLMALGSAKPGASNTTPKFDLEVLGTVDVPAGAKPGTTTFGTKIQGPIAELLRARYPGVNFEFRIEPGQTGVDVTVPLDQVSKVGFRFGDIKPLNFNQIGRLAAQEYNWGYKPGSVCPITYDNAGNVYRGFGTPTWVAAPRPVVPIPADPNRGR